MKVYIPKIRDQRYISNLEEQIGHFLVAVKLTMKARLSAKLFI